MLSAHQEMRELGAEIASQPVELVVGQATAQRRQRGFARPPRGKLALERREALEACDELGQLDGHETTPRGWIYCRDQATGVPRLEPATRGSSGARGRLGTWTLERCVRCRATEVRSACRRAAAPRSLTPRGGR